MTERNKLDIEDRILPHSSDSNRVSAIKFPIQPRLWPILLLKYIDSLLWRREASKSLRLADIVPQSLLDLLNRWRGLLGELEGYAESVAVDDRDAVASGADDNLGAVGVSRSLGIDVSENLARLPLNLLLLAADVGDDVINHIERGDTGVATSGNGLEGGNMNGGDGAEGVEEGLERDDETGGGAVGVGNEEALGEGLYGALVGDNVEMSSVDKGDDEGGDGVPAVVFRVGEDCKIGSYKFGLCGMLAGVLHLQR